VVKSVLAHQANVPARTAPTSPPTRPNPPALAVKSVPALQVNVPARTAQTRSRLARKSAVTCRSVAETDKIVVEKSAPVLQGNVPAPTAPIRSRDFGQRERV
jgi:hypothetical protein